ncbi:MAG: YbhB/YbcL family Raf kinase inhibitor-like protein [Clostridiales bacterium]|nr:YbhB/YbcL family Raf kinase inhibitor-like protein [Clostridiales bacterium]
MKRWLPALVAMLMIPVPGITETALSARLDGTVLSGALTLPAAEADVRLVLIGESGSTRMELADFCAPLALSAGAAVAFSCDLSGETGTLSVREGEAGAVVATALTDEARSALLAGALRLQAYRAGGYDTPHLLAECAVEQAAAAMTVTSADVVDGVLADACGKKGTQKRNGIPTLSPALSVRNLPAGTAALAITMIDPDGHNWVHWLAANLPAKEEWPANASIDLADQMIQGENDFGFVGYGGPTPPSGTHTYVLTVYALSEPLALKTGFSLKSIRKALEGLVLSQAVLTADYRR